MANVMQHKSDQSTKNVLICDITIKNIQHII